MTSEDFENKVRDGLFSAASRTYGEQYIEPFIRKKYDLQVSNSSDFDAIDKNNKRYEIKASKVLRKIENLKTKKLIDRIQQEINFNELNRLVFFYERETADYLANIQNVKRDHFDFLIYVLLFADCIKIFRADCRDINSGIFMHWCDKHGRYDELGKSGQFGINKNIIDWHLKNCLIDTVTYEEMTEIYRSI